jgi:hypothetical protein
LTGDVKYAIMYIMKKNTQRTYKICTIDNRLTVGNSVSVHLSRTRNYDEARIIKGFPEKIPAGPEITAWGTQPTKARQFIGDTELTVDLTQKAGIIISVDKTNCI